jgi:hypothetical protein
MVHETALVQTQAGGTRMRIVQQLCSSPQSTGMSIWCQVCFASYVFRNTNRIIGGSALLSANIQTETLYEYFTQTKAWVLQRAQEILNSKYLLTGRDTNFAEH